MKAALIDDESCTSCGIEGARGGLLYRTPHSDDVWASVSDSVGGVSGSPKSFGPRMKRSRRFLGSEPDGDLRDLASSGWAAIFPETSRPEVREALAPLFEHRRREAASADERRFRLLEGSDGYRSGDSRLDFLVRHGVGPGKGDATRVPKNLLLVGGPEEIPWSFQHDFGFGYCVGRLCLETPQEYANYAARVIETEDGRRQVPRKAAIFAPLHPGDRASELICEYLAGPLAETFEAHSPGWEVEQIVGEAARREDLLRLLTTPDGVSVLFAACHGVGYGSGDPMQRELQGALLCAESPGPARWQETVPKNHVLSADAIDDGASPPEVCFFFACHGAGTPRNSSFPEPGQERRQLAPAAFAARLPQRLLGLRKGTLAVIGHIERGYCYSFVWPTVGGQIGTFKSTVQELLDGAPVGAAFQSFPERYAELATSLDEEVERVDFGGPVDKAKLARLWTARTDARGYAILGDPAVRLRPAADDRKSSSDT